MEIVHVVAINPYRKGNKGKVFSYNIDTYDKVIESAAVKKMIQQIRGELPIDGVDLNDAQAVKKAQERLKSELPFFCPHYGMFKNNVRRQENALPESFLFQTIIDVDDKEYVEKAIEKARELNCSSGIWNGSLLHLCYSARKKLHIGIRMSARFSGRIYQIAPSLGRLLPSRHPKRGGTGRIPPKTALPIPPSRRCCQRGETSGEAWRQFEYQDPQSVKTAY